MKLNIVPARTGWHWAKLGMHTLLKQPLGISGLFFMFFGLLSVVSLVPWVGPLASLLLVPALNLGLMLGSEEAHAGRFPMPNTLFAAFSHVGAHPRRFLVLGAMYAVCALTAAALATWADNGEMEAFQKAMQAATQSPPNNTTDGAQPAAEPTAQLPTSIPTGIWLFLLLHFPISVAFWFAPPLVHWHGVPPSRQSSSAASPGFPTGAQG